MCQETNIFDDGQKVMVKVTTNDVKEMAKTPDTVSLLEERVKGWIKKLSEILKESEQIRRENDTSGKNK